MEETPKKDTYWRYFWELNRVTATKWYKNSSDLDKKAIIMALDAKYPIGTARAKATMTTMWTVLIYAIAAGVWGLALNGNILWFVICGAILGFLIGVLAALVIVGQRTIERANEIQFAHGATWGIFGVVVGMAGLIIWIVRIIIFR